MTLTLQIIKVDMFYPLIHTFSYSPICFLGNAKGGDIVAELVSYYQIIEIDRRQQLYCTSPLIPSWPWNSCWWKDSTIGFVRFGLDQ